MFTGTWEGAARQEERPNPRRDLQKRFLSGDFRLITVDVVQVVLLNATMTRRVRSDCLEVKRPFAIVDSVSGEVDFRAVDIIRRTRIVLSLHQLCQLGRVSASGDSADRDVTAGSKRGIVAFGVLGDNISRRSGKREWCTGVCEFSGIGSAGTFAEGT